MKSTGGRGGILLRTMITVMVPLLAVVLALGFHFTNAYMQDARDRLDTRGQFMAKHLASLSEFSVYAMNFVELRKHADSILNEPDVALVTIRGHDGNLLVTASNDSTRFTGSKLNVYEAPVVRSGVTVDDYPDDEDSGSRTPDEVIGAISISLSDTTVIGKQRDILYKGIVITVLGLLLSFALAFFVARSVTSPITRLTQAVDELTGGHLDARIQESSPGELGALEHGINQMAKSLEGAREDLVIEVDNATAALMQTVRQLEQRNVDLDIAREVAQRAGDAKSEFLARMSHEIRTPLSAVIGFSRLLEESPQSETQYEYTRTIMQAASQLLLIIDDILDFSRLDTGTLTMENASFDLHESLENMIGILSTSAHDRQLELVLLIHSDVPQYIRSDEKRINQILTNLVSNAIKFTETGHVVVNVSTTDAGDDQITLTIDVTDTGIGLDEKQAGEIFKPFTQADVSTSRRFGGTGLGLAICQRLTDLLGGTITVKSSPGQGATFSVSLPVTSAGKAQHLPKPLTGLRILVYDANPFTLRSLRNRFILWGATVFNTADHEKFLQMLEGDHLPAFDLIVSGLPPGPPGNNAENQQVQSIREITTAPLLLLACHSIHGEEVAAGENGQVGILVKPARSERMLRVVRKLTGTAARDTRSAEGRMEIPEKTERPQLHGLRVLLAEDSKYIQAYLQKVLSEQHIDVTIATNGEEACALATTNAYDIILMDIHMPVMGGIEAVQGIREGMNARTPVIALTADVFACPEGGNQTDGFDDCINKPVSETGLLDVLHRWSGRQHGANARAPAATGETGDPQTATHGLDKQLHMELGNLLGEVRRAAQEDMTRDLHEHMHQLKGIVDYFRLDEFREVFRQLQQAVESGQRTDILDRAGALAEILDGAGTGKGTGRAGADGAPQPRGHSEPKLSK